MRRFLATLFLIVIALFGLAWAFGYADLRQTREAKLPHISVQGGQAPKFDADLPEVRVGSKTENVTVPTVDVRKSGD